MYQLGIFLHISAGLQVVLVGAFTPVSSSSHSASFGNNHLNLTIWAAPQVVLVGVPGAFTPVCSSSHIPGFVEKVQEFADKGINYIGVIANNE